ncbi:MAG: hypothetical protein KKA76_08880 [Proteobacteria bacterium]|nr:hypothetical protein [Pseudomonadota bacterium]
MKNNKAIYIFCTISLMLAVVYPALAHSSTFVGYFDELACVVLFGWACMLSIYKPVTLFSWEKKVAFLFLVIVLIGTVPYIISQPNVKNALFHDSFVFSKSIIAYFSVRILFRNINIDFFMGKVINFHIILLVLVVSLIIINRFLHFIPESNATRFGIVPEQLFFQHPSRLAFFSAYIFCILFPSHIDNKKKILVLALLPGLMSLRVKFLAFAAVAALSLLFIKKIKKIKFLDPKIIIFSALALFLVITISYRQAITYYSADSYYNGWARSVLTVNSISLSIEHFPIGTGFGTFGSYASGKYYSPLNYQLGFQHIYGLSPNDISFIADTFWPMLLGQFGIIGCIIFATILFLFLKNLIFLHNNTEQNNIQRYLCFSGILLLVHLIIDSTSDAIFTQNRGVLAFIFIALIVNTYTTTGNTTIIHKK